MLQPRSARLLFRGRVEPFPQVKASLTTAWAFSCRGRRRLGRYCSSSDVTKEKRERMDGAFRVVYQDKRIQCAIPSFAAFEMSCTLSSRYVGNVWCQMVHWGGDWRRERTCHGKTAKRTHTQHTSVSTIYSTHSSMMAVVIQRGNRSMI